MAQSEVRSHCFLRYIRGHFSHSIGLDGWRSHPPFQHTKTRVWNREWFWWHRRFGRNHSRDQRGWQREPPPCLMTSSNFNPPKRVNGRLRLPPQLLDFRAHQSVNSRDSINLWLAERNNLTHTGTARRARPPTSPVLHSLLRIKVCA